MARVRQGVCTPFVQYICGRHDSCDTLAGSIPMLKAENTKQTGWAGWAPKRARNAPGGGGVRCRLLGSVWGDLGGLDPLRFPQFTPKVIN